MNLKNPAILAAGAFLAAWSATNFDLDYRAILSEKPAFLRDL